MNNYKTYMDRIHVSGEFHDKLLNLKETKPSRRPAWQKYATAACAVLLVGAGVWRVGPQLWAERWRLLVATFETFAIESTRPSDPEPVQCAAPTAPSTGEAIDLAPEDPNGAGPGMKTIGGYEEYTQIAGVDVTIFHILPWIDYGTGNDAASVSQDWDIPAGATRRDLSADEIVTLLGGADGVNLHLDWSEYELTGWAAWYADGSFWGAYLMGYKGPMDHFEFAVTSGSLPPTCIVFGDSVEQEIWGMTVTADKHDGKDGCSRRVSFMKDDYGYRFDLTATGETEDAEKLVSRAVTWVANGDGLSLYTLTGEEPPAPKAQPDWDSESQPPSPPPQSGASAPSVPPAGVTPD